MSTYGNECNMYESPASASPLAQTQIMMPLPEQSATQVQEQAKHVLFHEKLCLEFCS